MELRTAKEGRWQILLLIALLCSSVTLVLGDPTGATISNNVTQTAATVTPGMMNNSRGTITTMVLTSLQQSSYWKAYVGNVSGQLTLDNQNNYTIYSWDLTTISGQVYATRTTTITWSGVACANNTIVGTEELFNNMSTGADNISKTFNWTIHRTFLVGATSITNSTCKSTVTYVNDTRRVPNETMSFQEILLQDTSSRMIYLADISDNSQGYDNDLYDFQMIVAESDRKTSNTAYYFWVELR